MASLKAGKDSFVSFWFGHPRFLCSLADKVASVEFSNNHESVSKAWAVFFSSKQDLDKCIIAWNFYKRQFLQ